MKKMITLLLALVTILGCTACGQKEEAPTVEPDVTEMRAICELSVMDCYYHNVAKYFEEDAQKGFLGIGKKDKHFWIEYSGIVRMGIDVSLVKVEVEDMQVTITIPEAKVLKCTVDSKSTPVRATTESPIPCVSSTQRLLLKFIFLLVLSCFSILFLTLFFSRI